MAKISLRSILDDSFIKKFQGIAQGAGSPEKSIANALKGQSSQATIQTGLRVGARTFSTAVQGLNTAITFLHTSKSTLEALDNMTDKMIDLAARSARSSTTDQERQDGNLEFRKLISQFEKTIKNAKLAGKNLLTIDGINEIFATVGLDKESSDSISQVLKGFKLQAGETALASGAADPTITVPAQAYSKGAATTADYESLFDDEANIRTRPNAYKVLADLQNMKKQIHENIKAGEKGIEVISKNVSLVREAGLAFLELSDQIDSSADAEQVAEDLRRRIRKNAPQALSQAENLEPIVVAALALNPEDLGLNN